jgi:hypothetical protein
MAEFRRTVYLVLGVLAAIAMSAVPLRAQSDRTNWNNLKKAKAGQEIEIVLNDATSYKGTLTSWSDAGIVAQVSTGEMMFTRSDVMRVARHKPGHRLRHTLVAAGIGAGFGGIFVASCGTDLICPRGNKKLAVASVTLGLGALVGAILPNGRGWEVIYRRS